MEKKNVMKKDDADTLAEKVEKCNILISTILFALIGKHFITKEELVKYHLLAANIFPDDTVLNDLFDVDDPLKGESIVN